jgi:hypothetical protein
MKKILSIGLMMISFVIYAQVKPRQLVNGKITANQNIENVTIYNLTSQKGAISNIDGEFSIYARTQDTLVFASLVLQTKKIVMKDSDFEMIVFNIKLDEKVNELEEVVVSNNSLTGNLKVDADNIKIYKVDTNIDYKTVAVMEFEKDLRSSPDVQGMYNFAPDKYGMDFMKIGKLIGKALNIGQKSNSKADDKYANSNYNFKDFTLDTFDFNFFEKDLKLKREEIGIFLDFCASDSNLTSSFLSKNKFEKIEALFQKKKEYDQK